MFSTSQSIWQTCCTVIKTLQQLQNTINGYIKYLRALCIGKAEKKLLAKNLKSLFRNQGYPLADFTRKWH